MPRLQDVEFPITGRPTFSSDFSIVKPTHALIAASLVLSMPVCAPAAEVPEPAVVATASDNAAAKALLERAVARYRTDGNAAFAAFSRAGDFLSGDLYVYALGFDGTMRASGGPSIILVDRNIADLKDADGKPFIREMLEGARIGGTGTVKYRWLNPQYGKSIPKVVHYQAVGDVIIAVGYYIAHSSADQARSMLWRAIHELRQDPEAAIRNFNDLNGGFIQDDLYVFVIDLDDQHARAHGSQPRLIGKSVGDLRDADGKPFIQEMIRLSAEQEVAQVDYLWMNPVTRKTERKLSFVKRVGRHLVGVGAYMKR
ncbi:MAG: cache domain-containing protein [Thauera sp.]